MPLKLDSFQNMQAASYSHFILELKWNELVFILLEAPWGHVKTMKL
jgi:hypothetical protein